MDLFLITTADERTWKFDRPVLFLGEWCRKYDRKHIWQHMDAVVAAPYGLGVANKDADYSEARALEGRLLVVLSNTLNQYHLVQHGLRFWKIVLGHWLRRYVDVMLNRVKTLEQCLQAYNVSATAVYVNENYSLATLDSYSAIWAFNDDRWNNEINARILELLELTSFHIEFLQASELSCFRFNQLDTSQQLKKTLLKSSYQQVRKLARCFLRDDDAFIINSYLPKKEAIQLQLSYGQLPQFPISPKLELPEKADRALRKRLGKQFVSQSGNSLEHILSTMLFELLPVCYLEGFSSLKKLVKQQPWPNNPKFILTSNNFDVDEVFKLWTATKVESGYKYFVGQHGNGYGTHRYMSPTIEESTADKFITWGWAENLLQHSPAFIFKTAGRKVGHHNPQGGLVLIEACLNHRITTWDSTYEFTSYFEEQQKFVSELTCAPKQQLTIRLSSTSQYLSWNEKARWQTFDTLLNIDVGNVPIVDLIAKSRLVIHSYDSTGILETLSQNIPTLVFWQNGFEHLNVSAKPYYQLLIDAGIVHLTPESAAQKVNQIWDNVEAWWLQSNVQEARNFFCAQYARHSQNPIKDLKKHLLL